MQKWISIFLTLLLLTGGVKGASTYWTNLTASGDWVVDGNWNTLAAPTLTDPVFFTNSLNQAITFGSAGVSSNITINAPISGTLEFIGANLNALGILTITGGANKTNNLILTSGDLTVTNGITYIALGGIGSMTLSNGNFISTNVMLASASGAQGNYDIVAGTNLIKGTLVVGNAAGGTGVLTMAGGYLVATNNYSAIGFGGVGTMTLSNGTFLAQVLNVGADAATTFGSYNIVGGTNIVSSLFRIGHHVNCTGIVVMSGGNLFTTNTTAAIGSTGVGTMIVSNGTFRFHSMTVTDQAGSVGTYVINGGTNIGNSFCYVGFAGSTVGQLTLVDGYFENTNGLIAAGFNGTGNITVSNGTFIVKNLTVNANASTAVGTYDIFGGTNLITGALVVNGLAAAAPGKLTLSGGSLIVTGSVASSIANGGTGRLVVSNGTFLAQQLQVGNAESGTGRYEIYGGTNIIVGTGPLNHGQIGGTTGITTMSGGYLAATNANVVLGINGVGQLIMSNGFFFGSNLWLGNNNATGRGNYDMVNGSNVLMGTLRVGDIAGAVGVMTMAGGYVEVTNDIFSVGYSGVGTLSMTNGTLLATNLIVGNANTAWGTLTNSGTGMLVVTNGARNAVLNMRRGTNNFNGGTTIVDKLFTTNDLVGYLNFSGGTLQINNALTASNGVPFVVGNGATTATCLLTSTSTNFFRTGLTVGTNGFLHLSNCAPVSVISMRNSGTMKIAGTSFRVTP